MIKKYWNKLMGDWPEEKRANTEDTRAYVYWASGHDYSWTSVMRSKSYCEEMVKKNKLERPNLVWGMRLATNNDSPACPMADSITGIMDGKYPISK